MTEMANTSIVLGKSAAAAAPKARGLEDMEMVRAAAQLTRDISAPRPDIYWPDFLISAALGYGGMAGVMVLQNTILQSISAVVAVLLLYRAGSFIHELTHQKRDALPGFHRAWNILVGIPLLLPSFLYEGVHSLHHARTRYGTAEDPEYLPLGLMKPWTVPLFVLVSSIAPIGFLLRFGVLTPLTLLVPPLRTIVRERYSGLIINPSFRRKPATGDLAAQWKWQEGGACIWSIGLIAGVVTGAIPLRYFLIYLGLLSATMVLNQLRTLVAHLWENDGKVLTQTEQYLDSVNTPHGFLPEIWAPVGLRYHALHHLLPVLPYHSLPEAHRRLMAHVAPQSQYHGGNYNGGLLGLIGRLVNSTMRAK